MYGLNIQKYQLSPSPIAQIICENGKDIIQSRKMNTYETFAKTKDLNTNMFNNV